MKIITVIILIVFVATFVAAPSGMAAAGTAAVDKGGRKDRPKDPPPEDGKRPDRPKPPPKDEDGTRPPREKPDPPLPPDRPADDDDGYVPPQPGRHPHPLPCPHCHLIDCGLDHGYYYDGYDGAYGRRLSTAAGLFMLGSGAMMFVNLMYAVDEGDSGTGAGVAGLVLGGIGLVSAFAAEAPEAKTNLFVTALASIGFAAINLTSDPPPPDPIVTDGPPVKSNTIGFSISF